MNLNRLSRAVERIIEEPRVLLARLKGIPYCHSFSCLTAQRLLGKQFKTVIDIGANEGSFIKAANYVFPDAKIYAFEPQTKFYDLIKNLQNVIAFNFGLWNAEDEAVFYINSENTGASSFLKPLDDYMKYIGTKSQISENILQRKRFDKLNITIERPCFVKIDVEGAEEKVLKGFGDKLKEVDILQIEWFFRDFNENQMKLGRLLPLLEKSGFAGFIQRELGYIKGYPAACDLIFFKKRDIKKQ
jgi:FkbM family methyltransferase